MKYLLDASVALKWVLPEPNQDRAQRLRDDFRQGVHELIAPDVFPIEIAHVLSKLNRQKKLSDEDSEAYLAEILSTPPEQFFASYLLGRAFELSLQTRASIYDCLYLALAEDQSCSLVTAKRTWESRRSGNGRRDSICSV